MTPACPTPRVGHSIPEEVDDLTQAMEILWRNAGFPSTRGIAAHAGEISHSTVHGILRGTDHSRWKFVEMVANALYATPEDVEVVRVLWKKNEDALRLRVTPISEAPVKQDSRLVLAAAVNSLAAAIRLLAGGTE